MQINELKQELSRKTVRRTVNELILAGPCASFKDELAMDVKEALMIELRIHIKNIEIVGSAKLGFSLNPDRMGKLCNTTSDVDLALISNDLFDLAWHDLLDLEFDYYKLKQKERDLLTECYNNIPHGFISPDKMPMQTTFAKKWWSVFSGLSNKPKYDNKKIRGRLFKDWWFAEKYYSIQLKKLSGGSEQNEH